MPVDAVKQVKAVQQILNLLIGGIRIGRQALVFHTVRKLRKVRDDTDAKAKGSTTRAGSGDISERRKLSAARTH